MEFLESEISEFQVLEENEREKNSEKKNTRCRRWVGTWNNPKMSDNEFSQFLQDLVNSEVLKYAIFQREEGEKEHTQHFQFFVDFKSPQYFSKLKSTLLPYGCHFAPMISNPERCKAYCSKVDTRVAGPYEFGEYVEERARTDLSHCIKLIDEGIPFETLAKIYPTQCLMYSRQLKEREKMILTERTRKVWRNLKVCYIYGDAGAGKTRYVMEKYGYDKVYRVSFYDNRAFDGYRSENVILFDEFRSSFKITDMLHYLDGYPLDLPCRYNDKPACYTEVFIISNIPLSEQYKKIQEEEPETYKAFLRRIHKAVKFYADGRREIIFDNSSKQIEMLPILDAENPFED